MAELVGTYTEHSLPAASGGQTSLSHLDNEFAIATVIEHIWSTYDARLAGAGTAITWCCQSQSEKSPKRSKVSSYSAQSGHYCRIKPSNRKPNNRVCISTARHYLRRKECTTVGQRIPSLHRHRFVTDRFVPNGDAGHGWHNSGNRGTHYSALPSNIDFAQVHTSCWQI
jgi:hypothetical protein